MLGEVLVFTGDHRHLEIVRQFLPGPPVALQVDGLAVDPGFDLALHHQHAARWRYPAQDQHQGGAEGGEPEGDTQETAEEGEQHRLGLWRLAGHYNQRFSSIAR